jgi:hypothetical protein
MRRSIVYVFGVESQWNACKRLTSGSSADEKATLFHDIAGGG